jgi:hypothetical protein
VIRWRITRRRAPGPGRWQVHRTKGGAWIGSAFDATLRRVLRRAWTALGLALEELERPKAKERQGTRTDLQLPGETPESPRSGETREIVANAVGTSGCRRAG